jgi:predicted RND superfamily exporter protein
MYGNWAFSWVQMAAHNKWPLSIVLGVMGVALASGIFGLQSGVAAKDWLLLATGIAVMSLALIYLLDSFKTALLQLGLNATVLLLTLGALGWLGITLDGNSLLGLVVLMTLITSNLIHILTSVLREMARGLFQFDALAEALKLNNSPIFLSNFTTLLGFALAALYEPQFAQLAWVVIVGAVLSYLMTLTLLPLILLSWLLEFRVGHSADRHGYAFVVGWLQRYPRGIFWVSAAALSGLAVLLLQSRELLALLVEFSWMLLVIGVLLWVFWRCFSIALLNTLVNAVALMVTLLLFSLLFKQGVSSLLLLMVPMGLIVDDGIHFFARYVRAKRGVFSDREQAVRYAMASVARPIWLSSWTTLLGLAVLFGSDQLLIQQASVVTMLALGVATLMVLLWVPALLIYRSHKI